MHLERAAAAAAASPGRYRTAHDGSAISAAPPVAGTTTGRPAASASSTATPNGSRSAQCRRHVLRASPPRTSSTGPASSTAPARSGPTRPLTQPGNDFTSTTSERRADAAAAGDRGVCAARSRTPRAPGPGASTRRASRSPPPRAAARWAIGRESLGVDAGVDDAQPAVQATSRIEVTRDRVRVREHPVGAPRRETHDRTGDPRRAADRCAQTSPGRRLGAARGSRSPSASPTRCHSSGARSRESLRSSSAWPARRAIPSNVDRGFRAARSGDRAAGTRASRNPAPPVRADPPGTPGSAHRRGARRTRPAPAPLRRMRPSS